MKTPEELFEGWFKLKRGCSYDETASYIDFERRESFLAGHASRDAEVDQLKKRINDLEKFSLDGWGYMIRNLSDENLSEFKKRLMESMK